MGQLAEVKPVQTTVNLPDSLYEKRLAPAASRGATVEQFIVDALARMIHADSPEHVGSDNWDSCA